MKGVLKATEDHSVGLETAKAVALGEISAPVRCTRQPVQNATKNVKFPLNQPKAGLSFAGIALRRKKGFSCILEFPSSFLFLIFFQC